MPIFIWFMKCVGCISAFDLNLPHFVSRLFTLLPRILFPFYTHLVTHLVEPQLHLLLSSPQKHVYLL